MKLRPIFYGIVQAGKLLIQDIKAWNQYLAGLEGDVQIIVERKKKQRSIEQNKYYWGVVVALISAYTGYTAEETHEAIKWKFLRKDLPSFLKDVNFPTVSSTTVLTTTEFEELMARIRQWASLELQVNIPEPNEPIFLSE